MKSAFPTPRLADEYGDLVRESETGMTLRQYYKAAALGLIREDYHTPDTIAASCARIADALLAEDAAHEKMEEKP